MSEDVLQFVQKVLETSHIHVTKVCAPYDKTVAGFDCGLREYLFDSNGYEKLAEKISSCYKSNTLYYLNDVYHCRYILMQLPTSDPCYIMIGPYTFIPYSDTLFLEYAEELQFPGDKYEELKDYYRQVPYIQCEDSFMNFFSMFAEEIYGGSNYYTIDFQDDSFDEKVLYGSYSVRRDPSITLQEVEIRYDIEKRLTTAVRSGNINLAIQLLNHFQSLQTVKLKPRFSNPIRETKNWLIVLNTILRKAVEQSSVHPYYIDQLSTQFAYKIEALTNPANRLRVMQDMVHKYCLLVINYNFPDYSPLVKNAIVQISLDLTADLSLNSLATQLSVNASHLSALFKKETGTTLTDYVNHKRIKESLIYLNGTTMQIQDICPIIGITDLNYFTKLFKRYMGQTPSEYRASLGQESAALQKNKIS